MAWVLSTYVVLIFDQIKKYYWSSGSGRRLIIKRSRVRVPAPDTWWTFFPLICCTYLFWMKNSENKHLNKMLTGNRRRWCKCRASGLRNPGQGVCSWSRFDLNPHFQQESSSILPTVFKNSKLNLHKHIFALKSKLAGGHIRPFWRGGWVVV